MLDLELSSQEVYKIPLEAAIMAQDTNRVFGPVDLPLSLPDNLIEEELQQVLNQLEFDHSPCLQGEILISQKKWCSADYLIEAIIYDVNKTELTQEVIIRYALESCLIEVIQLRLTSIAMNPLGTEYNIISCDDFIKIFRQALQKYQKDLYLLKKVILAPNKKEQIDFLKKNIQHYFGISPKITS